MLCIAQPTNLTVLTDAQNDTHRSASIQLTKPKLNADSHNTGELLHTTRAVNYGAVQRNPLIYYTFAATDASRSSRMDQ